MQVGQNPNNSLDTEEDHHDTQTIPLSWGAAFVNEANACMANALLTRPGSGRIGLLQAGQVVEVLKGPIKVNGIHYWEVFSPFFQRRGYTPEGRPERNDYWLDLAPTYQTSGIAHRLLPGTSAFVETRSGKPANLRSDHARTAPVLAQISGGTIVQVLSQPAFFNPTDGWLWWPVEVNGRRGWMAEIKLSGETNLLPLTVPVRCS